MKWPTFCRRHFQMHFLNRDYCQFNVQNFVAIRWPEIETEQTFFLCEKSLVRRARVSSQWSRLDIPCQIYCCRNWDDQFLGLVGPANTHVNYQHQMNACHTTRCWGIKWTPLLMVFCFLFLGTHSHTLENHAFLGVTLHLGVYWLTSIEIFIASFQDFAPKQISVIWPWKHILLATTIEPTLMFCPDSLMSFFTRIVTKGTKFTHGTKLPLPHHVSIHGGFKWYNLAISFRVASWHKT